MDDDSRRGLPVAGPTCAVCGSALKGDRCVVCQRARNRALRTAHEEHLREWLAGRPHVALIKRRLRGREPGSPGPER